LKALYSRNADLLGSLQRLSRALGRFSWYDTFDPVLKLKSLFGFGLYKQHEAVQTAQYKRMLEETYKELTAVRNTNWSRDFGATFQQNSKNFKGFTGMNVNVETSPKNLRSAYRQASLRLHPNKPSGDAEQFKAMGAVFDRLNKRLTRVVPTPERNSV